MQRMFNEVINNKTKRVGQKLTIGIKEGVLGDNYLTFKNEQYYRSDKKITDMLTPQNSK